MLPGPLRPELRLDPHLRRRVRRSWVRVAPVAVPLLLVCLLLPRLVSPGEAQANDSPGPGSPSAARAVVVPDGRVVVAVTPSEPAVLALLAHGDRVDVHGPAPGGDPLPGDGVGATGDAATQWLGGVAPVRRLASAAGVVATGDPLPPGSVALAVTPAEAVALAGAQGGVHLALLLSEDDGAG
ncbi:hypothetical protein [Aquipuribacter nitratireducens]|uniref:Flp pilus assembly protein RcpC/CpaB domain-containing protein n=1 Tax=Aquipuribacter nitratireducens TaxID=650104 RepID=A0ABW0GPD0_9MICO